jgi:hypothetical protein
VRCLSIRRYPRRPEGRRGIGRIDSLGPFSGSAPAALLARFFSVRAGNVSFLEKRPPWPGFEVSTTSFHDVFQLIKLAAPRQEAALTPRISSRERDLRAASSTFAALGFILPRTTLL